MRTVDEILTSVNEDLNELKGHGFSFIGSIFRYREGGREDHTRVSIHGSAGEAHELLDGFRDILLCAATSPDNAFCVATANWTDSLPEPPACRELDARVAVMEGLQYIVGWHNSCHKSQLLFS